MELFQDILQDLPESTKTFGAESGLGSAIDIPGPPWSNSTSIKMLLPFKRINKAFVAQFVDWPLWNPVC